jgi:N-acetylmuramic acid 6-phosphate etherase
VDDELERLPTEDRRTDLADLDLLPTRELVELMNAEDATVAAAVAQATDDLAAAIDAIASRLAGGGRLVYVGAGTSGRLAALDAAECGPTFSAPPGQVVALVADGEDAEDDAAAGRDAIAALNVGTADAVVGLSASGCTPYTVAALDAAARRGALTVAVLCAPDGPLARGAAHVVSAVVGPELIAGSTRLKAGTAQKLILNAISTLTMVRLGKTYGNLMVDVRAENAKLRARARRAVELAASADGPSAEAALAAAEGETKVAIVALRLGIEPAVARARLDAAGGALRRALDAP